MKVLTTWNYSKDTETDRLIQTSAHTFNRFYLKNYFLVLPHLISNGNGTSVVYLPDLNFQKHPSFVNKVKKMNPITIPVTKNKILIKLAEKILTQIDLQFDEKKINKLQNDWVKKEKSFWKFLDQIFPQLKEKIIDLEIRPTNFGTVCSFNYAKCKAEKIKITVYLRLDQTASHIAEAIISSIFFGWLNKDNQIWCDNWLENEAVIDFLLTRTVLNDLFPNYQPTLKNLRQKQLGKLVQDSHKYTKKLGIRTGEIFSTDNGSILIDQKEKFHNLTEKEQRLLHLLVENKNHICTVDKIGDILWMNEDEDAFSLWAIAKQVERLRGKFQKHGLSPSLIQAQRGQGYLLRD